MGTKGEKKRSGRFDVQSGAWWSIGQLQWWHYAVISVVALLCYVQTAGYGFVYDDNIQIGQNPRIRSFVNLGNAFTENFWAFRGPGYSTNYFRPLQTVTYMIGYALGGLSPASYHWISIILHIITCLTLCWAGVAILRSSTAAFWGALLFAVHPMHTESVSWVAGVTDVGCGLFYLLSLGACVRLREEGGTPAYWWIVSLSSFLLALLFKEMALTLPLMVLLLDFACDTQGPGLRPIGRLMRLLPFLAVLAGYSALRIHALGAFSRTRVPLALSLTDKLLTRTYFVGRYLQDLLMPLGQNAYQVFQPFSRLGIKDWLLPQLLLLVGSWLAFRYLRREKRLLFLAGVTVFALIPVLNLGGVGDNKYTERYLYIPSAGFCLLVAALIERYLQKRKSGMVLAALLVLSLALLTIQRNPVWRDDKSFYRTTLAVSPDAVPLRNNLGALLLKEKSYAAARQEFLAALDSTSSESVPIAQERAAAFLGLSESERGEGHLQAASEYAEKALGVIPNLPQGCFALGVLKGRLGDYPEAERLLRQASKFMPDLAEVHMSLGNVLFSRDDLASAELEYRKVIQLDAESASARIALALVLSRTNRSPEAASLLQEVLVRDPANQQIRQLLEQIKSGALQAR